jgi:hypothetical protein
MMLLWQRNTITVASAEGAPRCQLHAPQRLREHLVSCQDYPSPVRLTALLTAPQRLPQPGDRGAPGKLPGLV